MATTLIVSDIHLGARNSQGAALLSLLETDYDRLILNGDTIDHLNFHLFRPTHWKVLEQLRAVARQRELILIRGNHEGLAPTQGDGLAGVDLLACLLDTNLHEEYDLIVGRRRYVVAHGDRFDRSLNFTRIGDLADSGYRAVQCVSRPLAKWLKGRVKHWGGVVTSVRDGAVAYAREQSCHGVIAGHTHYAADELWHGVHYLNTGCWVDAPCSYVLVRNGQIELRHWQVASAWRGEVTLRRLTESRTPLAAGVR